MQLDFAKYKYKFTADFETSTDKWGVDKARVWLWDICSIKNLHHVGGNSIETFFQTLLTIGKGGYEDIIIAFHNLAYDGMYIINYLLEQGFEAVPDKPQEKQFTTLITIMGQHYAYEVNFGVQCKYHKAFKVTFVDSYKTIHLSVKKIAEAFNLPIMKGAIDYNQFREEGYIPSDEEWAYIRNDTEIVARALQLNFKQGLTKVTQPANALHEFKRLYGKEFYELDFPNDLNDEYLRKAYFGGMCYANPKFTNKILNGLVSLDINSMYPSAMIHAPLPYGYPTFVTGDCSKQTTENQVYIQRFRCAYELKPNHIPTLFKNKFLISNELHSTTSDYRSIEMTLTNFDIEMLFKNYNVYGFEPLDGYIFDTKKGYEATQKDFDNLSYQDYIENDGKGSIFYEYIKKWRQIKENNKGALRTIAKFMQNMLYGNFGKHIDGRIKVPHLGEDGLIHFTEMSNGEESFEYIPMAIFITSYCRYNLVNDILKHIDSFVYCDTDSMYLFDTANINDLRIHNSLYGAYKIEKVISKFKCLGSKRYICEYHEPNSDTIKTCVTCCGATDEVREQLTFDNFEYNTEFAGKRSVKTVKGGKHIVDTTYRINGG